MDVENLDRRWNTAGHEHSTPLLDRRRARIHAYGSISKPRPRNRANSAHDDHQPTAVDLGGWGVARAMRVQPGEAQRQDTDAADAGGAVSRDHRSSLHTCDNLAYGTPCRIRPSGIRYARPATGRDSVNRDAPTSRFFNRSALSIGHRALAVKPLLKGRGLDPDGLSEARLPVQQVGGLMKCSAHKAQI